VACILQIFLNFINLQDACHLHFQVILNNVRKSKILTRYFIFDIVKKMLNDIIADFFWLVYSKLKKV